MDHRSGGVFEGVERLRMECSEKDFRHWENWRLLLRSSPWEEVPVRVWDMGDINRLKLLYDVSGFSCSRFVLVKIHSLS